MWNVTSTETFSKEIKKFKKNKEFLEALDKKIKRLQEGPHSVGGYLSGKLHGYKSTRIIGKFRLIFEVIDSKKAVYLSAVDHRKFNYENF